jgi:pyridinium-3,5-bisthiocarboxylic acid mononucleotide nickel chelatase
VKLLYLDLVGGISGDMTVAALIELGVPLVRLREALQQVGLAGVELSTEPAQRHHLAGTRFIVRDAHGAPADAGAPAARREHPHKHPRAAEPAGSHPHRAYRDIRAMLEASRLPDGARRRALAVFARLAEAEGTVHGVAPEDVTFHEVGAWDSIADIVCTAVGLEHLGVEELLCSPVPTGSGSVQTAHGAMPLPAPATLLLLRGFPVVQGGPAFERTTPTGAAILAALARPAPPELAWVPQRVGLGIGSKDSPAVPNVLRAVLGGTGGFAGAGAPAGAETIECAEANLDDANPEWIGYLMERLLAAGALDVALIPVHMKKNRPGTLVQVLYRPALRDTVQGLLFSETTTLGVRYHSLQRVALPREQVSVSTPWGAVSGVAARHGGTAFFSPEFEACRRVAQAAGVPLREVYLAAQQAWRAAPDERA